MKYLLTLSCLLLSCSLFAQNEQEIKSFGKAYFKHFQKKDFKWIMTHFATVEDNQKKYGKKYKKEIDSKTKLRITEVHAENKISYEASLSKECGTGEILKRCILKDIKVSVYGTKFLSASISIFFSDPTTGQEYELKPGSLYKTIDGRWVVFWEYMKVYYHGNIIKDKMGQDALLPSQEMTPEQKFFDGRIAVVEPPRPPIRNDRDLIFTAAEQEAEFPGGKNAMLSWLAQNIEYPRHAREGNITGTVLIEFVVNTDGSIEQAKIIQEIGGGCGAEVMRIVKKMPKWKPAKNNGVTVRSYFTLPITFESPE